GTQAAIRAGYSANAARQQSSRLLTNAAIQRRLSELQGDIERRSMVDAEWVVAELVKIARADIRKFYRPDGSLKPIVELGDDEAAALSGVEAVEQAGADGVVSQATLRKIKRWDRPKVLELIGRHFGLWPQKVEHNHNWLDGLSADDLRIARDFLRAIAERGTEADRGDRPTAH
ncbi:MAG: terminase small subunit, partial [Enhydrobacter sp.]|nr:terminase small subunit [Enhydrobacter sp.]